MTSDDRSQLKVKDYMTTDVIAVHPDQPISDVIKLIRATHHDGFPVIENGNLVGYISSHDLIMHDTNHSVGEVMTKSLLVAHPSMGLDDAARVLFRSGKSKLPVVDDEGKMVGIITNTDVIRSHIERAHPEKVSKIRKMIEAIHGIKLELKRGLVRVEDLVPTQSKVYADELEGRGYELKKGLNEPIIVIQKPNKAILVDGHHRAVAAKQLGIKELDAYILVMKKDIKLGLEETAEKKGIKRLDDITILDYAKHPLVEVTERLLRRDSDQARE
ncbi:MAG TPA: CBS domain-containing protein [Candidatus Syntrophoarchaeum butanivorans]|uniref:CBS domain-containing protein n=1 Tax=Candidatus Syntropharchaeum butanivorans TaxID=1839936 RepID=A0A1F2P6S1_9EURY|nr:MAG: signal transduction protein with CBS domain protein [Candidatus Syntrophoarchaeum butanivorans]HDM35768.1 CBS domain-containing protein [Candidatus Syntrophoarchaeum butanivorans]HEC56796.1 CBS domain-containing protein [Candidatus Syntrophoarchaeum butanivorans]